MPEYFKPELLTMRAHAELSEKWVQDLVAKDPAIIGLGDLVLRDKERMHPRAGRLDLLLQDPETLRRYEVELQLGPTDESHIIRTIEYWDIERKRYPQYDHCAVLIAEDITSRFLNVISLFNGSLPFVAIQMRACKVDGKLTLFFTKVIDELDRGLVDDDEDASPPADRAFWEKRSGSAALQAIDTIEGRLKELDPMLSLSYKRRYIGIQKDGAALNFIILTPKKKVVDFNLKLARKDDIDAKLEAAGLDPTTYNERRKRYKLQLNPVDITSKLDQIEELMRLAYESRTS